MKKDFELFVFYSNVTDTLNYLKAGADKLIIDCETKDKEKRQLLYDTQINEHSFSDISLFSSKVNNPIICRINQVSLQDELEVDSAIENGVDEILLPMVRTPLEVEQVLKKIDDRCKLGILLETDIAMKNAVDFSYLDLSRVYIGLNDLAIERKKDSIFDPVFNGEIESIRKYFKVPFGFGGVTSPKRGYPIPCKVLINEMKKVESDFSFLRRSFFKDAQQINPKQIIDDIRNEFAKPIFEYDKSYLLS